MDALPLPRWVYVPGEDAEADHARLAQAKALVPARFEGFVPASHPALRYGLQLNDAGYFWECHEILEAVWAAAPQGGRDRILLRACIQIANANLKRKQQRPGAVVRLISEALAELDELGVRKAGNWGGFADGFPLGALASVLRSRLNSASTSEPGFVAFGSVTKI
jgi:predicted metal-dependent hydrolase